MGYNYKQDVWRWKKEWKKKKNPNELGLPVVDWLGVGLGKLETLSI